MAITNLSDIINNLTGGGAAPAQHPFFWFDNRIGAGGAASTVAQQFTSFWRYNKSNGANGPVPSGVGVACNNTTLGALPLVNPTGGRKLYLLGMELCGHASGVLQIYDRLLHCSGLDGTLTTPQTVGGAITRNTVGVGNEIWIEVYAQIGGTSTTITANYTNQDGVAKVSPATVIGGTYMREESRVFKLALADGDIGVRSVESVTLGGTTGVAGNFGVTIARHIAMVINEQVGAAGFRDFIAGTPVLPEIPSGACLAFVWLPSVAATNTRGLVGLHIIEA